MHGGKSTQAARASNSTIDDGPFPADLNGSNITYPWPVKLYRFESQGQPLEMAFMDVPPSGQAASHEAAPIAVLLHGRNFCAATWQDTTSNLSAAGYRVVIPDQVGFCKSSKPAGYQFSLHQLALNTHNLLTVVAPNTTATVIGHSLGGMLAARYALMYPSSTAALVLANPIGLEDWKAVGVPYQAIETTLEGERASTYASIRGYEQATYYLGLWAAAYDVWVNMLVNVYQGSQGGAFAADQALVVDMVLTQPVVYEFGLIRPRTLLLIGEKDTTAIGKQWSPPEVQARLGRYDVLGKKAAAVIPRSTYVGFPDLGHAPQIQDPARFHKALMKWLTE
ncbi:alpha/beta hydrolase fold domain-containing protein [Lasiosphaeris hirsuta]|uniref:Alpha/beta hydrolase fold domain-containing protein n=1 Tax=Lasiosphaeris hirsuta TaxID=260670 RepID=A0AA40DZC4_9PEZI|nr:alpha/beta hydrolase fold domain-containing protein [Lasiosphaeris hirsuta]